MYSAFLTNFHKFALRVSYVLTREISYTCDDQNDYCAVGCHFVASIVVVVHLGMLKAMSSTIGANLARVLQNLKDHLRNIFYIYLLSHQMYICLPTTQKSTAL